MADIDGAISALENLKRTVANRKVDSSKEKIGLIVTMQNQLQKQLDRNTIARNRPMVATTEMTLSLMPSITDHAVNGDTINSGVVVRSFDKKHGFS